MCIGPTYALVHHGGLCCLSLYLSTTGFLCGSCVSGTGVTGLLNRCEACDTANATLIVVLGKLYVASIYSYMHGSCNVLFIH